MALRSALRAVVRVGIVMSVVLSGITFASDDAEARRGGKVRTSKERSTSHDDATTKRKSDSDQDGQGAAESSGTYVPGLRVRSREASRGTPETINDAGNALSPRGYSGRRPIAASIADGDIDVPGCATGMICTVCLAGCGGPVNSIVDAQPMTPRPKPRE